jgi:hypothetical protein
MWVAVYELYAPLTATDGRPCILLACGSMRAVSGDRSVVVASAESIGVFSDEAALRQFQSPNAR